MTNTISAERCARESVRTFDPDFAGPADWASLYREHGLQVVPSYAPGEAKEYKRPVGEWRKWTQALMADEEFARLYGPTGQHTLRPDMGLITGAASGGVFVLDLDTHKQPAAAQWWSGLLALEANDMEPETPSQTTGGGGRQLLFRAPAGWTPPTGKTSIGVDVRGAGGFARLPPSRHESGRTYERDPGRSPDEVEVAEAPGWLCEAIDRLLEVDERGPEPGLNGAAGHVHTLTPPHATTPIGGFQVDGREEYMRDVVWAAVVDLYRDSPIRPPENDLEIEMMRAFSAYLAHIETRVPGPGSLEDRLEREGRGLLAFREKWHYAVRQWDTKVREAAGAEPPKSAPQGQSWEPPPKRTPEKGERRQAGRKRGLARVMGSPPWTPSPSRGRASRAGSGSSQAC